MSRVWLWTAACFEALLLACPPESERAAALRLEPWRFDLDNAIRVLTPYWWVSHAAVLLYLPVVFASNCFAQPTRAVPRKLLVGWNAALAVFSCFGTLCTLPPCVSFVYRYGWSALLCQTPTDTIGTGWWGFCVWLFCLSKFLELFDTVLLMARGKRVSVLHWFHHSTVLVYTMHALLWRLTSGLVFVSMNFPVHSVMYTYYAQSAALGRRLSWAPVVTALQTAQMALGVWTTLSHLTLRSSVRDCMGHAPTLYAAAMMYASYLWMFSTFFRARHLKKAI
jgi:hypothetical protein